MALYGIDVIRAEFGDLLGDLLTPENVSLYLFRYLAREFPREACLYYVGGTPGKNRALGSGDVGSPRYRFNLVFSLETKFFGNAEVEAELDRLEAIVFNWIPQIQQLEFWGKVELVGESFRPPGTPKLEGLKFCNMQFLITPRIIR